MSKTMIYDQDARLEYERPEVSRLLEANGRIAGERIFMVGSFGNNRREVHSSLPVGYFGLKQGRTPAERAT